MLVSQAEHLVFKIDKNRRQFHLLIESMTNI